MTMRPSVRPLLALLTFGALAACDSLIQPVAGGAAYVLETSPAVLQNSAVRISILSDTLWLHEDGAARRAAVEHLDFVEFSDTTVSSQLPYRYTVQGGSVEMEYVCPPNALCSPPPHIWGRSTPDGLELRMAFDPRPLLRYRRIHR